MEKDLRKLCRMQLKAQLGEATARTLVTGILGEPRASRNAGLAYADLFDANKAEFYFSDLNKIIAKAWDCFRNVFGANREEWLDHLKVINDLRVDAHAKSITESQFNMFRHSAEKLEVALKSFMA